MTDFRALLAEAGVSRPWLAARTGRTRSAVDHWCSGRVEAPAAVLAWLERRISDPPPVLPVYEPVPPGQRQGGPGAA